MPKEKADVVFYNIILQLSFTMPGATSLCFVSFPTPPGVFLPSVDPPDGIGLGCSLEYYSCQEGPGAPALDLIAR